MSRSLVGRDEVLQTLRDVVARGRHAATGVIISGDAGMGKTAVLRAALRAVDSDVSVLRADGIEVASNYAFTGLQQLLAPLLPLLGDALASRHREVLESALGSGAPIAPDDYAVAASVLALLAHLAQDSPVLIALDDIQWLDRGSLTALAFAVRRLADQPITVIAACRSDVVAGLDVFDVPEIALTALDAQSARRLLRNSASERRGPLSEEELDGLVEIGGGIPLALVELSSVEAADLAGDPRRPSDGSVRRLIDRLFGRRVAALSAAASTAVLVAALDDPTEHDAFLNAGSELGVTSEHWVEAEQAGVLRLELGRIEFSHPLLRRAVLDAATPQEIRRAHAALATAMLARGDPARALTHRSAAAVGADEELAVELEGAAQDYRARGGHPAAVHAFVAASRLSATASGRARRVLLAADAARRAGDLQQAMELARAARRDSVDPIVGARAELLQGHIDARQGSTVEALRRYQRVSEELVGLDPDLAATAFSYASSAAAVIGDGSGSLTAALRADGLSADGLSEDATIAVREALASAWALVGEAPRARPMLKDIAQWYQQREDRSGAEYIAEALIWLGDFGLARELLNDVAADARRLAAPGLLVQVLELRAQLGYRTGDWAMALADATEAVSLAHDTGQVVLSAYARAELSILLAARGEVDAARDTARQARDDADRHGLVVVGESARFALAAAELAGHRPDQALLALEPVAVATAAGGRHEPAVCLWVPEYVEALVALDRLEDAERAVDRLAAHAEHTEGTWARGIAARYRALVAPDEEFDALFAEAIAQHERCGMPFELARTRYWYGQRLRRAGRRIHARGELREALWAFTSLGARHWVDLAQRELTIAGERTMPTSSPSALESLTPQELRIAQRIGGGATNREAGAELFLSPKTIETHLTHIYRKLGVRSRSELAALVAAAD